MAWKFSTAQRTVRALDSTEGRRSGPGAVAPHRSGLYRLVEVSFALLRRLFGMRGVITGKDVLRHSLTICRLWGPRCYLRCLRAALSSKPSTFLEMVTCA